MGTIWGYHYAGGGFNCNLILDYSSEEHPEGNYSTVRWAVRITGYFPYGINWIMGEWRMSMGSWTSSNSGRVNIGGIEGGNTTKTLDSGSFDIGHDGNGNGSIPINFDSVLYEGWYDADSEYVGWDLPQINCTPVRLTVTLATSSTNSLLYHIESNQSCTFSVNGTGYRIPNDGGWITVNITGLQSNTYYPVYITNITNLHNGIGSNSISIGRFTNGYANINFPNTYYAEIGKQFARITNPPSQSLSVSYLQWQYNLNGGSWINFDLNNPTINNLNYNTTYSISLKAIVHYYNDNQLISKELISPNYLNIRTKFREPNISVSLTNTGIGTEMKTAVSAINTNGCQNSYTYNIIYKLSGNNENNQTISPAASSGNVIYSGQAGRTYTVEVTASDTDGNVAHANSSSIVCGAATAPTISGNPTTESYIHTADVKGIDYQVFSASTIVKKIFLNSVDSIKVYKQFPEERVPIGSGKINIDFSELDANSRYEIQLVISDSNNHVTKKSYPVATYPMLPTLSKVPTLVYKPKAHKFQLAWEPDGTNNRYYSSNLTYAVSIVTGTEAAIISTTSSKDKTFDNLVPETVYNVTIIPQNGYTYLAEDLAKITYVISVKTDADTWLYLHRLDETNGEFYRYKVFLVNTTYPEGLELRKPGIKVLK